MGYIFQHFKYMAEDYLPKVLDDLEKGYTALCAEAEKPNIDRLAIHDDLATCALLKVRTHTALVCEYCIGPL